MGDASGLAAVIAVAGIFSFFILVIAIVFYVLKSLGLSKMAENRGIENPWLAWIPIADLYIMGLLVGEMDLFNYHLDNLGMWLPVIIVGGMTLGMIPFLGVIIQVAMLIFMIIFINKLFQIYAPEQAVLYTILSVILGLFAIFVFVIRNNAPANYPNMQPPTGY